MRIKIFSIPIVGGEDIEAEMNQFLASHAIAGVTQQLVQGSMGEAYWSFCIRYTEGGKKATASKDRKKRLSGSVDYQGVFLKKRVFRQSDDCPIPRARPSGRAWRYSVVLYASTSHFILAFYLTPLCQIKSSQL